MKLFITSALAGATLFATGCEAERVYCQAAHGAFAVKLIKKTGDGACSELKGGVFGVQSYNYVGSDGRPDINKPLMAIQHDVLGATVGDAEARLGEVPDPAGHSYAKGDFSSAKPDKDSLCYVPTLAAAEQNIPALPEIPADPEDPESTATPAEPAHSFKYDWSNMGFLVSEAAIGNQFYGDLSYTADGCTATYEAWGLFPAVSCDAGDGTADETLCDPFPDVAAGRATGSGISPDFTITCDPDLLLCVTTAKPPAFK